VRAAADNQCWCGDSDALLKDWKAGVLIEKFTDEEYAEAGRSILAMVAQPEVRNKARAVAERLFDLHEIGGERYATLYENVLDADERG